MSPSLPLAFAAPPCAVHIKMDASAVREQGSRPGGQGSGLRSPLRSPEQVDARSCEGSEVKGDWSAQRVKATDRSDSGEQGVRGLGEEP